MPSFGEFDPVDVPWALSRLYVVRVIDGGADFVYRLAGEAINERHGLTLAGKRSSDLFPLEVTRQIFDRWRRITASPPPATPTASILPTPVGGSAVAASFCRSASAKDPPIMCSA